MNTSDASLSDNATPIEPIGLDLGTGNDLAQVTPNLLPCQINFDGKIPISARHWNPRRPLEKVSQPGTTAAAAATAAADNKELRTENEGDQTTRDRPDVEMADAHERIDNDDDDRTDDGLREVHFRGRLFRGRSVDVCDGYVGHVLQPVVTLESTQDGPTCQPTTTTTAAAAVASVPAGLCSVGTFQSIMVWQHDHAPDPTDERYNATQLTQEKKKKKEKNVSRPVNEEGASLEQQESEPTAMTDVDSQTPTVKEEEEGDDAAQKDKPAGAGVKTAAAQTHHNIDNPFTRVLEEKLRLASLIHGY